MTELLTAFGNLLGVWPLFYIVLGTVLGVVVGAIPGLGAAMLIALLLPLTFYMDSVQALIFLVSIYVGSVSGLISATLMKMPGTPSAIMTTLDGYPMAMRGEAGKALSLGIFSSFFGGLVSWLVLAALSPPLARFALKFGPYEYFMLVLMALLLISAVSQGTVVRGLIAAGFGFVVALVGPDVSSGTERLTFGIDALNSGFRLLPTLLGVFVISQVIADMSNTAAPIQQASVRVRDMFSLGRGYLRRHGGNVVRSSLIGTWIGILPGVGSAVAAIVSYSVARNTSKHPEAFGTGAEEGIVAAETANNASVNGALVPLLALGIPGSVVDAILIGALTIHNLQPGPALFSHQPDLAYGIIAAALVANVVMFVFMLGFSGLIARLCLIPKAFILPSVVFFCLVGIYTTTGRLFDVWIMLGFGIVGYLMRLGGLSIGAFVLGYILSPIAEAQLRTGLMLYDGSLWPMVTRPISLIFLLASLVILFWPLLRRRLRRGGQQGTAPLNREP